MIKPVFVLTLLLVTVSAAVAAESVPPKEDDKALYALGLIVASNLQSFSLKESEIAIVEAGMKDALLGRDAKVDLASYEPKFQEWAQARMAAIAEREKLASKALVELMSKEPGAERTPSGLVYIPMTEGSGPSPKPTDAVKVSYHGTLRDGTVFDSSIGEPATIRLSEVLPCWQEGIPKMKVGGKSKLVCPSDLAFGDKGQNGVKPGATVVFEVELLGIDAAKP